MPKGISQKTKRKRGVDRDSTKGPKRTTDEALRDRADIAKLYLEGLSQSEIAEELKRLRCYSLSQVTISNDLKAVRADWLSASVESYERTKMIELARLDQEEKIALKGWALSIAPKKKERTRTGTTDGKPFEEFAQEEECRSGNPAYLQRLESIRQRRCAILGFSAHQKSDNINAAIDTLVGLGYIVRLPNESDRS